jgi:hypothetical protein
MENQETSRRSDRPRQKFASGSMMLIACCAALAILGIFIGLIVVYGGIQAS